MGFRPNFPINFLSLTFSEIFHRKSYWFTTRTVSIQSISKSQGCRRVERHIHENNRRELEIIEDRVLYNICSHWGCSSVWPCVSGYWPQGQAEIFLTVSPSNHCIREEHLFYQWNVMCPLQLRVNPVHQYSLVFANAFSWKRRKKYQ